MVIPRAGQAVFGRPSLRNATLLLATSIAVGGANFWITRDLALIEMSGDSAHIATSLLKLLDSGLFSGDKIWGGDSALVKAYHPVFMRLLVGFSGLVDGSIDQRVVFAFRVWSAGVAAAHVACLAVAFRLLSASWPIGVVLAVAAAVPYSVLGNEAVGVNIASPILYSRQAAQMPFYLCLAYVLSPVFNSTNWWRLPLIVGFLSGLVMLLHNAAGVSIGLVNGLFCLCLVPVESSDSGMKRWSVRRLFATTVLFSVPFFAVCGWILVNYWSHTNHSFYDAELASQFWYWRYPDVFPPAHLRIFRPVVYFSGFVVLGGMYGFALFSKSHRAGLCGLAWHVLLWWQYYGILPCMGLLWMARFGIADGPAEMYIRRGVLFASCMYFAFVPLQIVYDITTLWLGISPPYMEHLRHGSYVLILAYSVVAIGIGSWVREKVISSIAGVYSWTAVVAGLIIGVALMSAFGTTPLNKTSQMALMALAAAVIPLILSSYALRKRLPIASSLVILMVLIWGVVGTFRVVGSELGRVTSQHVKDRNIALRGNNRPSFPFDTTPIDNGQTYTTGLREFDSSEIERIVRWLPENAVLLVPQTKSGLAIRNLSKVALYPNRADSGLLFILDKAAAIRARVEVEDYTSYYTSADWRGLMAFARSRDISHVTAPCAWPIKAAYIQRRIECHDLCIVEVKVGQIGEVNGRT